MLTSLSFIFLVGLARRLFASGIRLPRIIGMLLTGIVLGPYVLDLLEPSILSISSERVRWRDHHFAEGGLSRIWRILKKDGTACRHAVCVPASFDCWAMCCLRP